MYNREKTQKQLDKVQASCRSRLLTTAQIEERIATCEQWLADHKLPSEVLKHVTYHYVETVAKSYGSAPEATHLYFSFTTAGKVKDVELARGHTTKEPYGGCISKLHLHASKLFELEYDLFYHTDNAKQNKAFQHLVKAWGFSPAYLTAQV